MPDRREFLLQTVGALTGFAILPDIAPPPPRRHSADLGIGLVGAGRQGRAILDELLRIEGVRVAAVCDVVAARLELARQRAPTAVLLQDYRALLDRTDVAAVLVATPTHLHRGIVEDVLAAGKHVYCEAPLAHTVAEARAIATAAAQTGVVFQAGFQGRANPIYRRAYPLSRVELRDHVALYAQWHRKTSWRFGPSRADNWRLDPELTTGLAGEVGAQQFDVACWYRNALPVEIRGRGDIRLHHDGRRVADTIQVELRWADGVAMHYSATLANSFGGQYEVVHGVNGAIKLAWTHGWLFKEADAPTQGWEVYATRQQFHNDEGIVLVADATRLAAQGRLAEGIGLDRSPLWYALEAFVRSVTDGAPVVCSAADGFVATALGVLAHQAVVTGAPIPVPALG
jgi:predicted dehydrogenase